MVLLTESSVDLETSTGPMRVFVCTPNANGKFPAILVFAEIYQVTGYFINKEMQ